jgi:hypothetical protein
MRSKKGISGLVVAVLLVAISLTIGGLVMGWMSGFADTSLSSSTAEQKEQDECLDRSFKVISANVTGQGSDVAKVFTLIVENKGDKDIKGFLLKFSTTGNELFSYSVNNESVDAYSRSTYFLHSDIADATGANYPANVSTDRIGDNPSEAAYTVGKIEFIPIIDVVVDVTKEVKCTDRAKEVESSSFIS